MKLTKLQRHTAYIILLTEAENLSDWQKLRTGLCKLISSTLKMDNTGFVTDSKILFSINRVIEFFPELQSKKPIKQSLLMYWLPLTPGGWQVRMNLLKQCIEETL
jgi:hypothetical protein